MSTTVPVRFCPACGAELDQRDEARRYACDDHGEMAITVTTLGGYHE